MGVQSRAFVFLVWVGLLATSCGRIGYGNSADPGTDSGTPPADSAMDAVRPDTSAPDTGSTDSAVDTSVRDTAPADGMTALTCIDSDAGAAVGTAVVFGDSSDATDTYPTCGAGREDFIAWSAPADGLYSVVATSMTFTPMLGLLADDCAGAELACDATPYVAPTTSVSSSHILGTFGAGQPTVIVISDANADVGGDYVLDIEAVSCAAAVDVGTSLMRVTGTTASGNRWFEGSCGSGWAPEATIRFEAALAGAYDISTAGSTFDTILYVRDGDCAGMELACNDDVPGGAGTGGAREPSSIVRVFLSANQVIFIAVDGAGTEFGDYVVNFVYLGGGA